jgi:hypothetical protein
MLAGSAPPASRAITSLARNGGVDVCACAEVKEIETSRKIERR